MKKVYAKADAHEQHIGKPPKGGALLMPGLRPSALHTAEDQGDGAGLWVLDPEIVWLQEMEDSDKVLPRHIEDLWEAIGINKAPDYIKGVYADKKTKRANKPPEKEKPKK